MAEREQGRWRIAGRSGVVGLHAALMHTGQGVFFARPERLSHRFADPPNPSGIVGDEPPRDGSEADYEKKRAPDVSSSLRNPEILEHGARPGWGQPP